MSQVVELFRRPRTMLKMLYFTGDNQFFKKLPEINLLYDLGRKLFLLLARQANLKSGGTFRKIINRESYRDTPHRSTWTGGLEKHVLASPKRFSEHCILEEYCGEISY